MLQLQWLLSFATLFTVVRLSLSFLIPHIRVPRFSTNNRRQHAVLGTIIVRREGLALTTFDQMNELDSRLGVLERSASTTLGGFYEPHLHSFSVQPGSVTVRFSRFRSFR
jgi:hypothetical protein